MLVRRGASRLPGLGGHIPPSEPGHVIEARDKETLVWLQ